MCFVYIQRPMYKNVRKCIFGIKRELFYRTPIKYTISCLIRAQRRLLSSLSRLSWTQFVKLFAIAATHISLLSSKYNTSFFPVGHKLDGLFFIVQIFFIYKALSPSVALSLNKKRNDQRKNELDLSRLWQ